MRSYTPIRSLPWVPILVFLGLVFGTYLALSDRDRPTPPVRELSVAAYTKALAQDQVVAAVLREDPGTVTGTLRSGQLYQVRFENANSSEFRTVLNALSAATKLDWRVEAPSRSTKARSLLTIVALPVMVFALLGISIGWTLRNLPPFGPRRHLNA